MPRYKYIARDKSGKKVHGALFAQDLKELGEKLAHVNNILISATEEEAVAGKQGIVLPQKKVLQLTINLVSLLQGGLSLVQSLDALCQDTKDEQVISLVASLKDYIVAGGSLRRHCRFIQRHSLHCIWQLLKAER